MPHRDGSTQFAYPTGRRITVKKLTLTPPLLGFIVGTRAALAFGAGLMAADRIPAERRRRIALVLIGIGAATTIPAALAVWKTQRRPSYSY
jgi:hypothetical protein